MRPLLSLLLSSCLLTACSSKNTHPKRTQVQTDTKALSQQIGAVKPGQLDAKRINDDPALSGPVLTQARLSPDGKMVTMLKGRDDDFFQQDLWAYDLQSGQAHLLVSSTDLLGGEEKLSDEEKNRRERARIKGKGIVAYSWDSKGEQILFPLGGDVYVYDLTAKKAKRVTNTSGYETDARISGSGKYVSYVRDNDLYITDMETGRETRLSFGANDLIRNATASFVVQEELGRFTGYWLNPDESLVAYTQIDESPIKIEHRIEYSAGGVENIAQRYPFAGTDNATVKLGVVPITGGKTIWVDIGDNPDIYLARVYWSQDGKTLYAGILSRDQKSLKMLSIDSKTARSELLFEEKSPTWLNIKGDFKPLKDGGFLWTSERSGFRHIYRYDKLGKNPIQITSGNWPITRLNCVSELDKKIYFTGWQDNALERHIYSVDFDGQNLKQLSKGKGWHSASFSSNCASYIGTFSNKSTPPQTRAYKNDGTPLVWLNENKLDKNHPYWPYLQSHIVPEFGTLKAEDGTPLDYMLYKPSDIKPGEKRAVVTIVYGGPGVQRVARNWDDKMYLAQALADAGFVVFQLDNRGATGRGKKFEDYLYRNMAGPEVSDQSIGAGFLRTLPFVDPDRMGIYGWSYGGYMTLQMLAQTNDYTVGVAGAPVTDWALYDTAYTERFLGNPRPDTANYTKGAYENASVFAHIEGLTEPFLLIHGMADDNVVFRHSIKLMAEMQKRGRHNMRVMTYPGEKHGFRQKADKIHRDQEIIDFFVSHLQNSTSGAHRK